MGSRPYCKSTGCSEFSSTCSFSANAPWRAPLWLLRRGPEPALAACACCRRLLLLLAGWTCLSSAALFSFQTVVFAASRVGVSSLIPLLGCKLNTQSILKNLEDLHRLRITALEDFVYQPPRLRRQASFLPSLMSGSSSSSGSLPARLG